MPRILIADDQAEVRDTLRRVLVRAGYEVLDASDGQRCLDVLRATPVDLVIIDIFMPELDGMAVIARMNQEFGSVPILAISGGGTVTREDALAIARRFGATRTLAKPFEKDALVSAVREMLGEP